MTKKVAAVETTQKLAEILAKLEQKRGWLDVTLKIRRTGPNLQELVVSIDYPDDPRSPVPVLGSS